MKIEKAIEILQNELNHGFRCGYEDLNDAQKLGIEALECILKIRHHPFPDEVLQLPGETLEGR